MTDEIRQQLIEWADTYNSPLYFQEDPIAFPTKFAQAFKAGKAVNLSEGHCVLQDIEVSAIFAAHFAWGRRAMIVRDCGRLFDEMDWRPYDYVMSGEWRDEDASIHRTIKWSEVAAICRRLKAIYENQESIENLNQDEMRTLIFGQKPDLKAPCKKINMMRRWLVRDDGKVDLGVWKNRSASELLIPLDVHVYDVATALGLTCRRQKDITTVREITDAFNEIFPGDPCKGDFALFGYGVTHPKG